MLDEHLPGMDHEERLSAQNVMGSAARSASVCASMRAATQVSRMASWPTRSRRSEERRGCAASQRTERRQPCANG
eukprot:6010190-Prymnesium_polylepis.1